MTEAEFKHRTKPIDLRIVKLSDPLPKVSDVDEILAMTVASIKTLRKRQWAYPKSEI